MLKGVLGTTLEAIKEQKEDRQKKVALLGVEPGSKTATVPYRYYSPVRVLLEKSPLGMGGGDFFYRGSLCWSLGIVLVLGIVLGVGNVSVAALRILLRAAETGFRITIYKEIRVW